MKILIIASLFIFNAVGCQEKKENEKEEKMHVLSNNNLYYINFQSYNPYELRFNDVLIDKKNDIGSTDFIETLNEYILVSGKQILSINLLPHIGKELVQPEDVESLTIEIYKKKNLADEDFVLVKKIKCPIIEKGLPIYKYSNEIDLEVSYKNEGWLNSVDLENEDKKKNEKEIRDFYQNVRNIINNGDYESYFKLFHKQDNEIATSFSLTKKEKEEEHNILKERIINSKGKMKEIDMSDFFVFYYGKGRLVRLEGKNGISPLCAEREEVDSYYNFYLHRTSKGDSLEVIR